MSNPARTEAQQATLETYQKSVDHLIEVCFLTYNDLPPDGKRAMDELRSASWAVVKACQSALDRAD